MDTASRYRQAPTCIPSSINSDTTLAVTPKTRGSICPKRLAAMAAVRAPAIPENCATLSPAVTSATATPAWVPIKNK